MGVREYFTRYARSCICLCCPTLYIVGASEPRINHFPASLLHEMKEFIMVTVGRCKAFIVIYLSEIDWFINTHTHTHTHTHTRTHTHTHTHTVLPKLRHNWCYICWKELRFCVTVVLVTSIFLSAVGYPGTTATLTIMLSLSSLTGRWANACGTLFLHHPAWVMDGMTGGVFFLPMCSLTPETTKTTLIGETVGGPQCSGPNYDVLSDRSAASM